MEVAENLGVGAAELKSLVVETRAEVVAALTVRTADFDYPGNTVKEDSKDEVGDPKELAVVEAEDRKNRVAAVAAAAVHKDTIGEEEEVVEGVGFSADHNAAAGGN